MRHQRVFCRVGGLVWSAAAVPQGGGGGGGPPGAVCSWAACCSPLAAGACRDGPCAMLRASQIGTCAHPLHPSLQCAAFDVGVWVASGCMCNRAAELRVANITQGTCECVCILQEDLPQSSMGGSGDVDLPVESSRRGGSSKTRSNSGARAGLDALAGTSGAGTDGAREGVGTDGADPAGGEGANKRRFRSARLQKRAEREGPQLTQALPLTLACNLMRWCTPLPCG